MTTAEPGSVATEEAVARAKAAAKAELAAAAVDRAKLAGLVRLCASLTDLTSLNVDDTEASVAGLCERAVAGMPTAAAAAVCVYPRFVGVARRALEAARPAGSPRPSVATVVNFPGGAADVDSAARETREAVARGADEVDLVWPYRSFLEQGVSGAKDPAARERCKRLVSECKRACLEEPRDGGRRVLLKVIVESGELRAAPGAVADSAAAAVEAGADFVKTSTGKVPVGATLEDAYQILTAIRASGSSQTGFKASGGIRTAEQALGYIHLARELMGPDYVRPETFRFGASAGLWDNLVELLGGVAANESVVPSSAY